MEETEQDRLRSPASLLLSFMVADFSLMPEAAFNVPFLTSRNHALLTLKLDGATMHAITLKLDGATMHAISSEN